MKKEVEMEKMVAEDRIKTLQNIVNKKEDELKNTQMSLYETNKKQKEIELAKTKLSSACQDLEKKN